MLVAPDLSETVEAVPPPETALQQTSLPLKPSPPFRTSSFSPNTNLSCWQYAWCRSPLSFPEELAHRVSVLRGALEARGLTCLGEPSAVVPVLVGDEAVGRRAFRRLFENGMAANLVEYPAVAIGAARFRMQVQAPHDEEALRRGAEILADAIDEARAVR